MNAFMCLWVLLFILVATSSVLGVTSSEAFRTYFFVPRWKTSCGAWTGPPRRYPASEPPWWYVPYLEPFVDSRFVSASDKAKAAMTTEGLSTDQIAANVAAATGPDRVRPNRVENPIFAYKPNGPAPTNFSVREPYALLSDELKPRALPPGEIGDIGSESCFMTDFDRLLRSTGNFRQFTNNYKHGYPDSCSGPIQELTLEFYKDPGMRVDVPKGCL